MFPLAIQRRAMPLLIVRKVRHSVVHSATFCLCITRLFLVVKSFFLWYVVSDSFEACWAFLW